MKKVMIGIKMYMVALLWTALFSVIFGVGMGVYSGIKGMNFVEMIINPVFLVAVISAQLIGFTFADKGDSEEDSFYMYAVATGLSFLAGGAGAVSVLLICGLAWIIKYKLKIMTR